jgi:hypothetical protein
MAIKISNIVELNEILSKNKNLDLPNHLDP